MNAIGSPTILKKALSFLQTTSGRAIFLVGLIAAAIAGLAWLCGQDPRINFLENDRRAQWITFPYALDVNMHRVLSVDAVFRREFKLERQPRTALLHVRAGRRLELRINGAAVNIPPPGNWKTSTTVDVMSILRAGTNTIDARVFNNDAPPVLWLALMTDELTLRTDSTWDASFAGSAWRSAMVADKPRQLGAGNPLNGGERTVAALVRVWRTWLIFVAIAFVVMAGVRWWTGGKLAGRHVMIGLLIIIAMWLALFCHNARLVPFSAGFDSKAHLAYINYIQENKALPWPDEGFEMFQPPLYYGLSAAALSSCGLSINDPSAPFVLRALTMLFGIAHFIFIFLTLRLLFPDQPGRQLMGMLLAAFVPMQLYLSHFVTNEVLAAALAAGALYFAMRSCVKKNLPMSDYIWLGVFLGAGLLTKVTLGLLFLIVVAALVVKLVVGQASVTTWLRTLGLTLLFCFVLCGWHYLRIWRRFGTPFVTNLGSGSSVTWWLDPGYRTVDDYLRFGSALISPLFSGFNGFWDSIYSTMWGDALCAGVNDLEYRLPWNYDLMVAGYLLAMVPTALILIGAAVAIVRFVRRPELELFVTLAFSAAILFGLTVLTLAVSYVHAKAFYGLAALVAICYFGALGWGVVERGGKTLQFTIALILGLWALNSFASFWIRPNAEQHVYLGMHLRLRQQAVAATAEATEALKAEPTNVRTRRLQTLVLEDAHNYGRALEEARQATQLAPTNSNAHLQVGHVLLNHGQAEEAIEEARMAIHLGPENSKAHELLLNALIRLDRHDEAITAARDALAVSPFSFRLHYFFAVAATDQDDFVAAAQQSGYALLSRPKSRRARNRLQAALISAGNKSDGAKQLHDIAASAPDSPAMLNELAWLFATHSEAARRDGGEALRLAEHACALAGRNDSSLLATLAAAQAETGNFDGAKRTAEAALLLATSSHDDRAASLLQNLMASFRANSPYRASYP